MMEKILAWVRGYPGFSGITWTLESLPGAPGCGGVFCRGEEILERREDILGTTAQRRRLTVLLALTAPWDDRGDNPMSEILLDFGRLGIPSAPVFGAEQTVQVKNARLTRGDHNALARWEMQAVFEYDV